MTFKKTILSIICLLAAINGHAQYSDSVHYYTSYASSGSLNQTNTTKTYLLSNNLKLGLRKQMISLNATNSWIYGAQQQTLTNNDYTGTLDLNIYAYPHFFYWGLGNYMSAYSLNIISQYQGGAGAAYNVLDKKNAYVNLSDGILYEGNNIALNDSTQSIYNTFRNSFRLSFRLIIHDMVTLSGVNFLQSSLSDQNDYIIKSNLSLGFKLRKWLTLNAAYSYNKYTRTAQENTIFTYGLAVEKYF